MSDRDKISFSELDRLRRERRSGGGDRRPRSEEAERRSRAGVAIYKRKAAEQLFGRGADAARLRLEERLRESHGSPAFLSTYREYQRAYGFPRDPGLLVVLLDLDDEREVLKVLGAIEAVVKEAAPEHRTLLRSRLRNLEMSASSDAVADAAARLGSQL